MVVKLTGARPRYFLWKNIVSMYFSQYNPHTDKHHNCYVSCGMVLLYDTAVIVDLCTRFFPINLKCSSSHLFSGRWAQPERCRIKHTNSNHLKEKQHWKQNQTLILSDVLKQEPHTLWEERGHTHTLTHTCHRCISILIQYFEIKVDPSEPISRHHVQMLAEVVGEVAHTSEWFLRGTRYSLWNRCKPLLWCCYSDYTTTHTHEMIPKMALQKPLCRTQATPMQIKNTVCWRYYCVTAFPGQRF